MSLVFKSGLSLLASLGAVMLSAMPAAAQEIRVPRGVVLVTPEGQILDYAPDAGEVRVVRDGRGRSVLIDNWGNVVATAMPSSGIERPRRREQLNDVYLGPGYDDGTPTYDDGSQGDFTGSVPDYRDVVPEGVERQTLPDTFADPNETYADPNDRPADPNDTTAIDPADSAPLADTPQGVQMPPAMAITKKSRNEIVALQVFLDREGFSPGVIDGKTGGNVTKAIEAFQQATGETLDPNDTDAILERLRLNGGLPITNYTITPADAAGPYVAAIPEDYSHKAALPHLSYTSTTEMLAERFHMDEAFLKEFNPGVDL